MQKLIADIPLYNEGEGSLHGTGSTGLSTGTASNATAIFNNIISSAIGIMTIIAIIWFVFLFISGAIGIMSSSGDKARAETARKRITNGIIGLVVIVAAVFVIRLLGDILGISNILDPSVFIENMWQ
jgi:hypothetical protein